MNNIALIQERMIDDRKADVTIKNIYEKLGLWKETVIHLPLPMAVTRSISLGPLRRENHEVFLGLFPKFFFSPLVSLFNLTPRVILHQYSPTSWTWRRFQVCVWSFFSNSSYKRNEEREKCEPVTDSFAPVVAHHRMERKQRGSRVGAPSLPPLPFLLLPIYPRASPTYFLR